MPIADRIIGITELAAITGRSPRTIRRWLREGRLRRVAFAGLAGVWESDLIVALDWRGAPGSLVTDADQDRRTDDDAVFDGLIDDADAGPARSP